jgi:hypothetical protein
LPIAPSTYHAHVAKRRDPARLSARARQDAALKVAVRRVFDESFSVYGVRKVSTARSSGGRSGRHFPNEDAIVCLIGAIRLKRER